MIHLLASLKSTHFSGQNHNVQILAPWGAIHVPVFPNTKHMLHTVKVEPLHVSHNRKMSAFQLGTYLLTV